MTLPWEVPSGPEQSHRLVLSAVRGGVIDANDFNAYRWKPALRAVGVSCGRYENGMHELRHFFASVLLDQGESIKAVAEWLGHSDAAFTLKTYTHLMPSSNEHSSKSTCPKNGRKKWLGARRWRRISRTSRRNWRVSGMPQMSR